MRKSLLGFVLGILTLPVGALPAAWLGWQPTNANATPSALEKTFAHLALDSAAARRAPHLANPFAPTEENLMAGMKLFKGDCAGAMAIRTMRQNAKQKVFSIPVLRYLRCIFHASRTINCSGTSKAECVIPGCSGGTDNSAKTRPGGTFRTKKSGRR